jgi:hypothetical protein
VYDNLAEAEKWAKTIKAEPEKTTAEAILKDYKTGKFYK